MRIFVAGATGVIGRRLVPLLVADGHTLAGMTRSLRNAEAVRALGVEPVVCDVYEPDALADAVSASHPEMVMHQLTDLPDEVDQISEFRERNNRIRTQGTDNLVAAAKAAGVKRLVAQSIAWSPPGGADAVKHHERTVLEADGVVLRYGQLYGPGTFYEGEPPPPPRIHVDEAARRTVELLDASPGVVVITERDS